MRTCIDLPSAQPVKEKSSPSQEGERRAQPRSETVLSRIEDATYAVLRKYEDSA